MHAVLPEDPRAKDITMVPLVQVRIWKIPEIKELAKVTQLVRGNAGNLP